MAVKKKNVSLKIGKHKSRKGGLTAAGRKKYNRATGSNLKAPQPGGGLDILDDLLFNDTV